MLLSGAHRPALQRLRLTTDRGLGAGNFFWAACATGVDLDRVALSQAVGRAPSLEYQDFSLRQLRSKVVALADWYTANGIAPGDRVGLSTVDGLAGLLHHIAITSIGAVDVLVNPSMPPDIALQYFHRTKIQLLVADPDLLRAMDGPPPAPTVPIAEVGVGVEPGDLPRALYRHEPGDLVLISHSSGTTGVPKPATFTHHGFFVGKRERLWDFSAARREDRLLTILPHSHSSGISYLSLALLSGAPALMVNERSGASLAAAMNHFRPTVVIGFPLSMAELDVSDLDEAARVSVHTWMGMGDASHEHHIRPLVVIGRRRDPDGGWREGSAYVDGLGSSEMGMVLFRAVHTNETENYDRLVGRPVRVVRDAAVFNDRRAMLPPGSTGFLGVLTPSSTPGYWKDPELTATFRAGDYFLTGDVVRQGADGQFYHLDRSPDIIRSHRGWICSLPLEEVLLAACDALDTAVVAVDDPLHPGFSLPAAVVLFHGEPPASTPELLTRCNQALTSRGLDPIEALVVARNRDELPVGVTGKVLKRVLRDRHRAILAPEADRSGQASADASR